MTDKLDDKLRVILKEGAECFDCPETYADRGPCGECAKATNESIAQIKQAFEEEGYTQNIARVSPSGGDDTENIQAAINSLVTMTGQEWYERFDEIWGEMYREKKNPLTAEEFIEAAKRAVGLE